MQRTLLKSKLHRATITDSNLHYEGSLTIDENLLRQADILPYERISIYNVSNGERFDTYALAGPPGSGVICLNAAAARKGMKGDLIIIATYAQYSEEEVAKHQPRVILLDSSNHPLAAKG